ncbi:MAG: hypothetical protein WC364_14625 [Eubacteriales bacterium]|jgi:hypothetical protein
MHKIEDITADPKQQMALMLSTGKKIDFTLWYSETQKGWFYSFSYENRTYNGRRIVNSPNMLRAFRNILPFGLACTVADGMEPVFLTDFSEGRASIYLLQAEDIDTVEAFING